MELYAERFLTREYEMDSDGQIRIPSLCNYMEEAAGLHARHLQLGLEHMSQAGLAWVLAKMRLIVHRRPRSGEEVVVETWPVGIERIQFRRDFIIYDAVRKILATAVTQWVVMGLQSRKVERFPVQIKELAPTNPPLAQEKADICIPAVQNVQHGPVFPIRLADIDQNLHVNNGRYLDFVLESAHAAGQVEAPTQIDLIFRAESHYGQAVGSMVIQEEEKTGSLVHSLFRLGDNQELVRARTIHSSAL